MNHQSTLRGLFISRANDQHSSRDAPSQEIVGDIDPKNIISGSRRRQPASRRREAYATSVATTDNFSGFYATFSTGLLQSHSTPIHRDQLAPEPRNWRDMLKHGCRDGFLDAAQQEIKELTEKKTFKHVKRPQGAQVIPLKWVFNYKFDTDGFLIKFKSRLCVREDLQRLSLQDTYAATLTAEVFRTMMALTAAFDLETNQFDVKNAYPHADLDEVIYNDCPQGFDVPGSCLLLLKALYGLRRAPASGRRNSWPD